MTDTERLQAEEDDRARQRHNRRVQEDMPGGPCNTCSYLTRVRIKGNTTFLCGNQSVTGGRTWGDEKQMVLRERVEFCSEFSDKNQASYEDMMKIAWYVRTDASGKKIGFEPYGKLSKDEKRAMDDDYFTVPGT